ncbi:Uncharacterised protein [Burkholderia pseudomallei]|nr:hypothetical protein [Burkholderia pseudomallei]NAY23673.1 hypothetical protein [Burkholderia pseudomallei]CAJ2761020.1 Uncharacterised protein [Burkholderia pseudomallei]CAJ2886833.1 Uncharacterised protein [Burkholderia pseudomallei]CAJ3350151.1 Uncharacterised protein [Burkholderia pseudomallei]
MTCRFEDIFEISAEKRERRYETGDRMRGRRGGASCCDRRAGRAAGSPRAGAKHARAFQFVSPPHASAQRAARSSRAPARIGSRPAGVVAAGIHSMSRRHGARAPVMGAGAPAIHGIAAKTVAGIGREPRPPGASSAHADRAAGLRDARAGRHRRCRRSRVRALAWCVMRAACSSRAVARGIRFGTPWHPGVACIGDPAFKPFGNATILRIRTSNEAEKRGAA